MERGRVAQEQILHPGGRHAVNTLELAAEMRNLLEAEMKGNLLDLPAQAQQVPGLDEALFGKPVLRGAAQIALKVALDLPDRDADLAGDALQIVASAAGEAKPGSGMAVYTGAHEAKSRDFFVKPRP